MKRLKNLKKANNGITLIALVITIIVLLILAGVSISMLTGENGILTQASNASKQTAEAEADEIFKLIANEWQIEKRKGTKLEDFLDDKKVEYGIKYEAGGETSYILEYNGEKINIDSNGKLTEVTDEGNDQAVVGEKVEGSNKYYTNNGTAKIPVGYMIVPGCDDVSQGLVISDDPADTESDPNNIVANGNQFVWIPVTDPNKYVRNTSYANTSVSAAAKDDTDYLPEGITDEKQAVKDAGGFYIGRYEAGDSNVSDFRTSATEGTLVCKKNKYPYTYIKQVDAKAKAKTFIPADNTINVKSALISGIQWDVVMDTINNKLDGNGQVYDVKKASNAAPSDRHTSSKATTGQNIADKVYNIYDLEGNFREYVAEKNTYSESSPFVSRGGSYNLSDAASSRNIYGGNAISGSSFRPVLYVM